MQKLEKWETCNGYNHRECGVVIKTESQKAGNLSSVSFVLKAVIWRALCLIYMCTVHR